MSSILASAQRRMGHAAQVVQLYRGSNFLNYEGEDWRFFDGPGFWNRTGYRMLLMGLIAKADVVHAHGGLWNRGLARYVRWKRKRLIIHYHGDDLRFFPKGKGARRAEGLADAILYSTPDLWPIAPKGAIYIPNPVESMDSAEDFGGQYLCIIHSAAHETTPKVKGTDIIQRAVDGHPHMELRIIRGRTHQEALRLYREGNLAVCDMRIGWYGMFALECMAMGIPVLNLRPRRDFLAAPFGAYPVADGTSLRHVLESFLRDSSGRRKCGEEQRAFVQKHHDPMQIARRLEEIYET